MRPNQDSDNDSGAALKADRERREQRETTERALTTIKSRNTPYKMWERSLLGFANKWVEDFDTFARQRESRRYERLNRARWNTRLKRAGNAGRVKPGSPGAPPDWHSELIRFGADTYRRHQKLKFDPPVTYDRIAAFIVDSIVHARFKGPRHHLRQSVYQHYGCTTSADLKFKLARAMRQMKRRLPPLAPDRKITVEG
jgi:hypothetical protein